MKAIKNLFIGFAMLGLCASGTTASAKSAKIKYVKPHYDKTVGQNSEAYHSMTFDGSWCWFSDPRSVYFEGQYKCTYTGWIDSQGNIIISSYNRETGVQKTHKLWSHFQRDDHDAPSISIDKKGYISVFFEQHARKTPIYLMRSKNPEDISAWEDPQELKVNDTAKYPDVNSSYTYCNVVRLADENDKMFIFWRGLDFKPSVSTSVDNGRTWSMGKYAFMPPRIYKMRRPYTKVYSDGKNTIHFTETDGHPRNEKTNSVYYYAYKKGAYYRADGTKIKDFKDSPVMLDEADKVYDATVSGMKAWVWDVAADAEGHPIIAYVKFPNDTTHIYCRATWTGKKWVNETLVNSGRWFLKTPKNATTHEVNYSGGMIIDKENPETMYLSVCRKGVFEIEKWTKKGRKWNVTAITKNSTKDNIRPYTVMGAKADNPLQVLWLQAIRYEHYAPSKSSGPDGYLSSIKCNLQGLGTIDPMNKKQVIAKMKQAADWQLANVASFRQNRTDWIWGSFYVGLEALYKLTNDNRYLTEMTNVGDAAKWEPVPDVFHADRFTITDVWCSLYDQFKDEKMIDKTRFVADMHIKRGFRTIDLTRKGNPYLGQWWSWCDALYMAPPTFVHLSNITNDSRYIDYMYTHWKATSDYLYSKADSLYYRDDTYFGKQTEIGTKVFWSRGNGWVIGSLCRMLTMMPKDYEHRAFFVQQYKEMMHRLIRLQREDGLWTVSLLDNKTLPTSETSGSAFYTYAMLWGVNQGLLDASYKADALRAWKALIARVNAQGRLGYVQQVAGSPYPFTADQWQAYATGTLFLAGQEALKMMGD